ncbi:MAG TPA: aspartate kinase [Firmicutes bacterium]|jgi:aspartate kinase|nr:aspartate kinase [Bacillota bacterium]HBK68296.1 aspartate kinase [Bacillota bacterium]HBT15626.1 aspartate kinase [Bacillota bacterium]
MGIKVAKFGGSSLADAEQFRKVRAIIRADHERRYIVPSAPGKRYPDDHKITDLLYQCYNHVQHKLPFGEIFALISARYLEIIKELELTLDLKPILEQIKNEIAGGASAEFTASRGEYLNGILLAEYLGFDFVDPTTLIFFNHQGQFNAEKTQATISKNLNQHVQAVIPGFYGSTPDGKVRTFSRGGSDITGAIIARGVKADLYENWTDVSGFLMADPRVVKNPKPIKQITYRELRELAYMGASVLHEEAIFPVREAKIPINIKNTNNPDDPGTLIVKDNGNIKFPGTITGIAGRKGFTIIAIEKTLMHSEQGFGRKLLSVIENNDISFEHMPSGIDTISLVIADSQLNNKLEKVLTEIERDCQPDAIEVFHDIALIATVGLGMAYTPGIAAKLFSALAQINVRMIDQGSSEINIIVGVENRDFEEVMRRIYNAFVE